jgi:hypothetical protein
MHNPLENSRPRSLRDEQHCDLTPAFAAFDLQMTERLDLLVDRWEALAAPCDRRAGWRTDRTRRRR